MDDHLLQSAALQHIEQKEYKAKTKIISFIGTTPNIGTTLAALRHAYHIALQTSCKVGYICLNFKSSKLHRYFGLQHLDITLDELLPDLRQQNIHAYAYERTMYQPSNKVNMHILFGNRQRELAEYYTEDEIYYLIQMAKGHFDYLILDASAYWDNAGSFCSLQLADQIIVVTTDALSHFQEDMQKWFGAMSAYIQISIPNCSLLVIRQPYNYRSFSLQDIKAETNMMTIGEISFPSTIGPYLDRGALLEWMLQTSEGKEWCSSISQGLITPIHLKSKQNRQGDERNIWPWAKKAKQAIQ